MSPRSQKKHLPKPVFVFDNPRSRSHLFFRWISTSGILSPMHHPFLMATLLGPQRFTKYTKASPARRQQTDTNLARFCGNDTPGSCRRQLDEAVFKAQNKGLIPFANEHCALVFRPDEMFPVLRDKGDRYKHFTNPTHIPDDLFNILKPILVIRHPLLILDSLCKAIEQENSAPAPSEEDFEAITTLKLSRHLFDGFCSQGRKPLVVEGDDVLWRTVEVAKAVCDYIGISTDDVNDTWEPYPELERPKGNAYAYEWTKVTWESSGILRPAEKPDEPALDKFVAAWDVKYGSEAALALEKLATRYLPDYEYLVQFKVGGPLQNKQLMTPTASLGADYFNLEHDSEECEEPEEIHREDSCTPF